MEIIDMLKMPEEDPRIDKSYVELVATVQDGGSIVLERFDMNPYDALKVLHEHVLRKEMDGINKVGLN